MNAHSASLKNAPTGQGRDGSIDLLRFVALTCIILAHVNVSSLLMQIRNFDVPLMVFLSGVSFRISGANNKGYHGYVWNRFKRLILPTWIFLSLYCAVHWLIDGQMLPLRTVISYYSLMTPWFVWIIRVFFVMALIAPPVSMMAERLSKRTFIAVAVACLLIFEAFLASGYFHFKGSTYLLMNIPWAIVFAWGYKISEFKNGQAARLSIISLTVFACLLVYYMIIGGGIRHTQGFKYPPRIYYLAYAMAVTFMLWSMRDWLSRSLGKISGRLSTVCRFLGSHTMWIYLWHILVLGATSPVHQPLLRFVVVYAVASLLTLIQTKFVNMLNDRIASQRVKKNLRMIFIG